MKNLSKFMSLILRHKPESINIKLDEFGYIDIQVLLYGIKKQKGFEETTIYDIEDIVKNDKKGRYIIKSGKIRANQGHSIEVNLELKPQKPPITLYHGTPDKSLEVIIGDGLKKMQRNHVHLSEDIETATIVGTRRGQATIIFINAIEMFYDGIEFYRSENGVWLTDYVDPSYFILYKSTSRVQEIMEKNHKILDSSTSSEYIHKYFDEYGYEN